MYPGTIFNWHDQSEINSSAEVASVDNKPLFMVVSSFDKGPEELMEVDGDDFANLFGTMYFSKHGQNAIQAQNIINAGGKLLVQRVCAEDSTISNVVFVATVKTSEVNKTDAEGNNLYLNESGEETTTVTDNPVKIKVNTISWEAKSYDNCKTIEDVKKEAIKLLNVEGGVFPLFVFTDNGRGVSSKAIRIIPDYSTSKNIGKMFYTLAIYEGTANIEQLTMTFDPDVVYNNQAYGLDKYSCTQIKSEVLSNVYDAYIAKLAELAGSTVSEIRNNDLIFGYTYKGAVLDSISVDAESTDLNASYGIELKNGSNGAFKDAPVNTEAWAEAIRAVYAGEVTDEIYDVDTHKIVAILDANFPQKVKDAISTFVTFRKDCVFLRDGGIGNDSFAKIKAAYLNNKTYNNFISDFVTSYQIKDPTTKRNIEVTMLYDMGPCIIDLMQNGPFSPLAGTANGFILENAIKGTVNYTPIVTPTVNQKQAMDDIRVNYAIFEGDNCVVQSEYTSQEKYTQLSYLNNVMAIQYVTRIVRETCPKSRYSLSDGSDLSSYSKAVNNVISNYSDYFDTLEFDYTADPLKASQKIFYASLKFAFKNWAQTEIFDIYAINNN
nr:MAG TPA: tail sheath protein [Caudoviricetes sp.]